MADTCDAGCICVLKDFQPALAALVALAAAALAYQSAMAKVEHDRAVRIEDQLRTKLLCSFNSTPPHKGLALKYRPSSTSPTQAMLFLRQDGQNARQNWTPLGLTRRCCQQWPWPNSRLYDTICAFAEADHPRLHYSTSSSWMRAMRRPRSRNDSISPAAWPLGSGARSRTAFRESPARRRSPRPPAGRLPSAGHPCAAGRSNAGTGRSTRSGARSERVEGRGSTARSRPSWDPRGGGARRALPGEPGSRRTGGSVPRTPARPRMR